MEDRRNAAIRAKIQEAFDELEAERERLVKALDHLGSMAVPSIDAPLQPDKPKAKRRRRKRAPAGQREAQFLAAVKDKPGITVAEIAKQIGVSPPNALYALANRLAKAGKVVKSGAAYRVKGAAPKGSPKKAAPKKRKSTKRKKG
jgi:predicted ArsR family transcriptional regulator